MHYQGRCNCELTSTCMVHISASLECPFVYPKCPCHWDPHSLPTRLARPPSGFSAIRARAASMTRLFSHTSLFTPLTTDHNTSIARLCGVFADDDDDDADAALFLFWTGVCQNVQSFGARSRSAERGSWVCVLRAHRHARGRLGVLGRARSGADLRALAWRPSAGSGIHVHRSWTCASISRWAGRVALVLGVCRGRTARSGRSSRVWKHAPLAVSHDLRARQVRRQPCDQWRWRRWRGRRRRACGRNRRPRNRRRRRRRRRTRTRRTKTCVEYPQPVRRLGHLGGTARDPRQLAAPASAGARRCLQSKFCWWPSALRVKQRRPTSRACGKEPQCGVLLRPTRLHRSAAAIRASEANGAGY